MDPHHFSSLDDMVQALLELINWVNESDYSDDVDPRLTEHEWLELQSFVGRHPHPDFDDMVTFLTKVPASQVVLPDDFR